MSFIWDIRMQGRVDLVAEAVELGLAQGILPEEMPTFAQREPPRRINYSETDWYGLFQRLSRDLGDPDNDLSRDGNLFRRRFRVPFSEFHHIYQRSVDEEWFGYTRDDAERIVPLFMKEMGVFRLLGRNLVYDDVTEISKIHEETMRVFYMNFVDVFSKKNYQEWMKQPQTREDIAENETVYRANG
jgi:hypothetical protein